MSWYLAVLKKYATFAGRARRTEYWMFSVVSLGVVMVLSLIDGMMMSGKDSQTGLGLLSGIYAVATLLPNIAVTVRRLHDIGKSGWWMLISLIPLIGGFILLWWMFTAGEEASNEYGDNPKLLAND